MKNNLRRLSPVLLVVAVAAALAAQERTRAVEQQGGSAAPPPLPLAADEPAAGNRLLVAAMNQLERRSSVTARLRFQVSFEGHQLYGAGSYWQQGSAGELRARVELQLVGQDARLLQVSNSRFLWLDQELPAGRTVTRVDLRQLRADPTRTAAADRVRIQPGEASWSPLEPELLVDAGGLPSLLASLSRNFSFLPPQAMRLAIEQPAAAEAATIPVFAVVGHWKPEKLAALVPRVDESLRDSKTSSSKNRPAERLPQEVLLLIGQTDLFPYRIEYRQLETPITANDDGAAIPYQLSASPMVVLELSDVSFDTPIAAGQFDYSPGEADWTDRTADHLNRLRR